jgi:hypothetical protein
MDKLDFNTVALLIIALINVVTAFLAARTHALTQKVEVATNSMKDALVRTTRSEAHAAGVEEGRLAGVAKAATLEEGRQQGTDAAALIEKEKPK